MAIDNMTGKLLSNFHSRLDAIFSCSRDMLFICKGGVIWQLFNFARAVKNWAMLPKCKSFIWSLLDYE